MSILNCNHVVEQSVDQLIERRGNGQLKLKPEMDIELVKQLRQGVVASPMVRGRVKELLGAQGKGITRGLQALDKCQR